MEGWACSENEDMKQARNHKAVDTNNSEMKQETITLESLEQASETVSLDHLSEVLMNI